MDIATASLRTAISDLNGQMRGSRMAASASTSLEYSGQRMPLAMLAADIWGDVPAGDSLDGTGQMRCTERGPVLMPWLEQPATLVPMWMYCDSGKPCETDPRHALARVIARFAKRSFKPVIGSEIEFTLIDDSLGTLAPVTSPLTGRAVAAQSTSLGSIDLFAAIFDDIFAGAEAMSLPLSRARAKSGGGQFQLSLDPAPAMQAADDLWLLKALVRGTARRHGLAASFMAKPIEATPGSGLMLHLSVLDEAKRNIFDNGLQSGSSVMKQAIAGCIASMAGATLIFAPYANSYARLNPSEESAVGASWGYANRTTTLRVPAGPAEARRFEHRTAGADANPYLAIAAVLGGALMGIEDDLAPPEPILGTAQGQRLLQIPTDWHDAIERFATSPKMARIFPAELIETYAAVKRQEDRRSETMSGPELEMSLFELV